MSSKSNKVTTVIIILGVICSIGGCLYFAGGVSATTAPIRIYNYKGNKSRLESGIYNLVKEHKSIRYRCTDTVGNKNNGFAFYSTITLNKDLDSVEYYLKFEENRANNVEICLVGAINFTNLTGGYSVKAKGINHLLKEFDIEFLKRLREDQHVELILDDSFWDNFSIY